MLVHEGSQNRSGEHTPLTAVIEPSRRTLHERLTRCHAVGVARAGRCAEWVAPQFGTLVASAEESGNRMGFGSTPAVPSDCTSSSRT